MILRTAEECRQPDSANLRDTLSAFLNMEQKKSINSWEAVLYRSILEDDALMKYLETATLPEYL
ncbi:hypothetical protein B9T12_09670 [Wohlfahrtiimonas chitiniclastica]|nr:hypothetical protein B9T12_09670 [Wohlfahrtiimonas chitiniclastica]